MAKPMSTKSRHGIGPSFNTMITYVLVGIGGIYIGLMMGSFTCNDVTVTVTESETEIVSSVRKMTAAEWRKEFRAEFDNELQSQRKEIESLCPKEAKVADPKKSSRTFSDKVEKMVYDYATIPRDEFNKLIEIGVPMDDTKKGSEEVILFYSDPKVLPYKKQGGKNAKRDDGPKEGLDPTKALENCQTLKVILQEPATKKKQQCIALVPQWESYHVHKFMRLPKDLSRVTTESALDDSLPLRYVGRGVTEKGQDPGVPNMNMHTNPSFGGLTEYIDQLETSLENLRPLVKEAVNKHKKDKATSKGMKKSNIVVVLVCNKGQAHLFHNFVCNARAKGLDLSRIVMFATDTYTANLSKDLGIPAVYDEKIFGDMPEDAARSYGDRTFSQMMMAKVYCVHLVMSLGYDVLFQDVDVVWQKNPLEYLETQESKEWDMIFQDDGSRQPRYQPYSPNTGFYLVRNREVTRYFFNSLVKMGDLIMKQKSHQAALTALMSEFVGWKGMRVKVWPRGENTLFPGGFEYHQRKDYMRKMIAGEIQPYIFHMSWTQNKDNKQNFYDQMAEWYTKDEKTGCKGLDCCVTEPIITCHYNDKPSFIPCSDSPPIDKKGRDFWAKKK